MKSEWRWEKHGDIWIFVANGWKRAIVLLEGTQYYASGIFGFSPIHHKEITETSRKRIFKAVEAWYREALG